MVNEEELLQTTKNGKTYLENILANQLKDDITWCKFKNEKSLRLILAYKRYDLLKYVTVSNMLRKNGDHNYLDYILESLKERKDYKTIVIDPFEKCISFEQIVDVYITYCRNRCLSFLPPITMEDLLKAKEGKIKTGKDLLEVFEKKYKNNPIEVSFIMKKFFKNDSKIMSKFSNDNIDEKEEELFVEPEIDLSDNTPSEKYLEYYNNRFYDDYSSLSAYDKRLIDNLCFLLKGRCEEKIVNIFKRSYSNQLALKLSGAREEINLLFEILENDKSFTIEFGDNSYFSPGDNLLSLTSECISVFDHEMGHVLFRKVAKGVIEEEFYSIVNNIRNDKKHLSKIKELSDKYFEVRKHAYERAVKIHDKNTALSKNDEEEYKNFVNNREENIKALASKGVSEEFIEKLLSTPCSFEDFSNRKKTNRIAKLRQEIMRNDETDLHAICDIVDAIYCGEFKGSLLKDENGNTIKSCVGHGLYYYNKDDSSRFNEIIANYSLLKKSVYKNSIKLLKYYTSKEFVNYLDKYYEEHIINGTIEKIDSRFL